MEGVGQVASTGAGGKYCHRRRTASILLHSHPPEMKTPPTNCTVNTAQNFPPAVALVHPSMAVEDSPVPGHSNSQTAIMHFILIQPNKKIKNN